MKSKVYLETTIVSYLVASSTPDIIQTAHQQVTRQWWRRRERFALFVSRPVLTEAGRGDATAAARRLETLAGEAGDTPEARAAPHANGAGGLSVVNPPARSRKTTGSPACPALTNESSRNALVMAATAGDAKIGSCQEAMT